MKENKGLKYRFHEDVFQFFLERMSSINWDDLSKNVYDQKYMQTKDDITTVMEKLFNDYHIDKFKKKPEIYDCDTTISKIDSSFSLLYETFEMLKDISEKSKSSLVSSMIVKEALDIMILTYVCLSTIEIV